MFQLAKLAYRHCGHAEHFGIVMVAICDTFEAHRVLWFVSLWLVATGIPAFIRDIREL